MRQPIVLPCVVTLGCGASSDDRVDDILALSADTARGAELFSEHCARCHGEEGSGGSFPDIRGLDPETVIRNMLAGPSSMPEFGDLPDADIADIAAHVDAL